MPILKGLRFGMLLQLAIGPVFFFIFQTAAQNGFAVAETGVLGVFLIDALYIFLAVSGVSVLLEKKHVRPILKLAGAVVLFVFGAVTILNAFQIRLLPVLSLQSDTAGSAFMQALILTASSPLTILFWAGIFSAKIAEPGMSRKSIRFFALGTVLSTLIFLSATALFGSLIGGLIPSLAAQCMNAAVGCLLVFFGAKMLLKKNK